MELAFASVDIRVICLDPELTSHGLLDAAEFSELQRWVADLLAAQHVGELAVFGLDLNTCVPERIGLPLGPVHDLVCRVDIWPTRRAANGIRWDLCHRIQIVNVEERSNQ